MLAAGRIMLRIMGMAMGMAMHTPILEGVGMAHPLGATATGMGVPFTNNTTIIGAGVVVAQVVRRLSRPRSRLRCRRRLGAVILQEVVIW
jgi:hypothetical protein